MIGWVYKIIHNQSNICYVGFHKMMTDFKTDGEFDDWLIVRKAIKKQNERNMDLAYTNEEIKAKIIANALQKKNESLSRPATSKTIFKE